MIIDIVIDLFYRKILRLDFSLLPSVLAAGLPSAAVLYTSDNR
jgi:hypothetical protein